MFNDLENKALSLSAGRPLRDLWYASGASLWKSTYAVQPEHDAHAMSIILAKIRTMGLLPGAVETRIGGVDVILDADLRQGLNLLASTKWVHGGCQILQTDARYFAAMANTHIAESAVSELRVPWPAFVVEWPEGLCVAEDGTDYSSAIVLQADNMPNLANPAGPTVSPLAYIAIHEKKFATGQGLTRFDWVSLADLLFANRLPERVIDERDSERSTGDVQIQEMVCRAIAGLLYTVQHTKNWRSSPFPSPVQRGHRREAPPPHRVISIGRPLSLDATENIRSRAAGRAHGSPAVQTLVRGHIKRQVVGKGRAERKVIWIEPYWRGPEEALILSRPRAVTGGRGGVGL